MNRRRVLFALGTAALGCAAWRYWPDEGIRNPCVRGGLPAELASHELPRAAWEGIDPAQCWDCHVHVAGVGDGGTGVWITPRMRSLARPWPFLQRLFYLNAACTETEGRVDRDFVERLMGQVAEFPAGAKAVLLAFDFHHDEQGARREDLSAFHVPNRYAAALAHRFPQRLEWIASIHPYRAEALEALEEAARGGARAIKWLPSAMGIDPGSARCDRFYEALVRLDLPLLTHAGDELAVHGGEAQQLGNPLRLRRPLEHGVRVIVAHCASLGSGIDLDRGPNGPAVDSFGLFARLMDEARYAGRLFGEISAMTQLNRVGRALDTIIRRGDWHGRLLNGSDYPLPAVMPLFSLRHMVEAGYIGAAEAGVLSRVRRFNPLLFDFALKRRLRRDGHALGAAVFETRRFFQPGRADPRQAAIAKP